MGRTPQGLLDAPTLPDEAHSVWEIFLSLDTISYSELQAREALTGEQLGQWEIDVIMALKRIRMQEPSWPKKQH